MNGHSARRMPTWQRRVDLAWLRSTIYLTALKQIPKPFCCGRLDRDLYNDRRSAYSGTDVP